MIYTPFLARDIEDVNRELIKLARQQTEPEPEFIFWQPSTVAPFRPRQGMLAWADGVAWNPGAGAGTYEYRAGAWFKL